MKKQRGCRGGIVPLRTLSVHAYELKTQTLCYQRRHHILQPLFQEDILTRHIFPKQCA